MPPLPPRPFLGALSALLLCLLLRSSCVSSFAVVSSPCPLRGPSCTSTSYSSYSGSSSSSVSSRLYSKNRPNPDGSVKPPLENRPLQITITDDIAADVAASSPDDSASDLSSSSTDPSSSSSSSVRPLLVRAAFGEVVSRPPVWLMRQAGRHMSSYRSLVSRYPTFKQRSEIPEIASEISLQPWNKYGTDAAILFSDILTPLTGMGVSYEIEEKKGPVMSSSIDTWEKALKLKTLDPTEATPFVGQALKTISETVKGTGTAVVGFVGAPFTLATYMLEGKGGSSTDFRSTKEMMSKDPKLVHHVLEHLCENIKTYASYQIDNGAEVMQLFDSWAGVLSPSDYDVFAAPYQKRILKHIKDKHPSVPTIVYVKNSGALLERLALVGADVVSLDWTVSMKEARRRIDVSKQTEKKGGALVGGRNRVNVQGNLDPALLFASDDVIVQRTLAMIEEAGYRGHIANLGHGVDPETDENKVKLFVDTVKGHEYVIKPRPFTLKKELKVQPKQNMDKKKTGKKKGF